MNKLFARSFMIRLVLFSFFLLLCQANAAPLKHDYLNTSDTASRVKSLSPTVDAEPVKMAANTALPMLKIKVLSGTGDINPAKALSQQLSSLGYTVDAIDHAPRSNFKTNTVYYANGYKPQAETLIQELQLTTDAAIKPLSWKSVFDLIIVAVRPASITPAESAPAAKSPVAGKARKPERQQLKIKVLSGDGDMAPADAAVKMIRDAGHIAATAGYAPRSDFTKNTIYVSRKHKAQGKALAKYLGLSKAVIKPLTWESEYDLILVTVSPDTKPAKMPSAKETPEAQKEETVLLREEISLHLAEAHEMFGDQDFSGAKKQFSESADKLKKLLRWLEKAVSFQESQKDQTPQAETLTKTEDKQSIRIQVLSKDVDLGHAKKIAGQVAKMGFEKPSVDYALRSDLDTHAIYFSDRFQGYAYDIAFNLEDDPDPKPMRWTSKYDIIVVTGESGDPERAAWLLKKYRSEENLLKEKIATLLSNGGQFLEQKVYAESLIAYEKAEKLLKKEGKLCEKSIQQAKLALLEEADESAIERSAVSSKMDKSVLTLEEAIKIAVSNSARIKEAEESLNSAVEEKKSAKADFFPKGTAEYQYTHLNEAPSTDFELPGMGVVSFTVGSQEMYEWNVKLTQPLFTGFALISQYKLKDLGVEAARTKQLLAEMDLVKDVKTAYFNLLLVQAAVKVSEEAVKNLESHVRDAEQYYKQGMIPYNDLLKSRVALAHVVQQREKALAGEKVATSALNTLLEFDINRQTQIEDVLSIPPVSYELSSLLHEAVENRPELKLIQNAVKSLDQGMRLAKSAYYPKIAVAGYYEQTGDNPTATENDYGAIYNSAIILNATWDFFEGGKTRADVAKLRYDKKSVMKKYETAENGIQLQVKNAFANLKVADKNIITAQESLVQAKENWRITDLQYKEQIATSTDVLDARTELTQAESNYYQALYGYMISLSELERAMGKRHVLPKQPAAPTME